MDHRIYLSKFTRGETSWCWALNTKSELLIFDVHLKSWASKLNNYKLNPSHSSLPEMTVKAEQAGRESVLTLAAEASYLGWLFLCQFWQG